MQKKSCPKKIWWFSRKLEELEDLVGFYPGVSLEKNTEIFEYLRFIIIWCRIKLAMKPWRNNLLISNVVMRVDWADRKLKISPIRNIDVSRNLTCLQYDIRIDRALVPSLAVAVRRHEKRSLSLSHGRSLKAPSLPLSLSMCLGELCNLALSIVDDDSKVRSSVAVDAFGQ